MEFITYWDPKEKCVIGLNIKNGCVAFLNNWFIFTLDLQMLNLMTFVFLFMVAARKLRVKFMNEYTSISTLAYFLGLIFPLP